MGIIEAIAALLTILAIVTKEFFAYRARERAANEKYELDKKAQLAILQASVSTLQKELAEDSGSIQDFEDTLDRERERTGKGSSN